MNTSFLSISRRRFSNFSTALWLLSFVLPFVQLSWGQDQLSLSSGSQTSETQWISGPERVSLGAVADLQIPVGYRFTDAEGARSLLNKMNNPVPAGLIGVLAPNSGDWLAVIEFSEIGHVDDVSKDEINSTVILKDLQDRSAAQNSAVNMIEGGEAAETSISWENKPVYDGKDHSLEWAICADTQSGKVINHTLVLLGRRGVLDITAVRSYRGSSDLLPLKQLVKGVNFKQGQSYADFQKGDKTAGVSLANLVVDDEHPAASVAGNDLTVRTASSPLAWVYTYYCLIGGGIAVFIVLLYLMKFLRRKKHRRVHHEEQSLAGTQGLTANGNGLNGVNQNGSNRYIVRKKKASSSGFGKFYTSMIHDLSSTQYNSPLVQNGNWDGHTSKKPSNTNGSPSDPAITSANLELLSMQKNFIEEQKRFMEQQSKLIDEKTQLIEEQGRLLKRQADVIENQFSLKFE